MINRDKDFYEATLQKLEYLITSALETKKALVAHQYEDAANYLDEMETDCGKIAKRVDEMWE